MYMQNLSRKLNTTQQPHHPWTIAKHRALSTLRPSGSPKPHSSLREPLNLNLKPKRNMDLCLPGAAAGDAPEIKGGKEIKGNVKVKGQRKGGKGSSVKNEDEGRR
ncbi:hypothetical protein AgCh_028942 [Apium graveolens]